MSPRGVVVTGTDTDVGKSVFCAGLATLLPDAHYWKPVQAGLDGGGDRRLVADLSGLPPSRILPEAYRLTTPCSPHEAAARDGLTIDPERLSLPHCDGSLIVEGAGGALVPLRDDLVYADMFAVWKLPVILVARTSLGTINHSLLSIEALRRRGLDLVGIAFVGDANEVTERTICKIGEVPRLGRLPRLDPLSHQTLAAAMASRFDRGLLG